MRHGTLYYFVADALADFRAEWYRLSIILRQYLYATWHDAGQSIAIVEADARAALRRLS